MPTYSGSLTIQVKIQSTLQSTQNTNFIDSGPFKT